MGNSLFKLEKLLSRIFENRLLLDDQNEIYSQLVPSLTEKIKDNLQMIDGKKVAPNFFSISIKGICDEPTDFSKDFVAELKIVIDEIITNNNFIRNNPLIINLCQEKNATQLFTISARHSATISGNTIRIPTPGNFAEEAKITNAELLFPNGDKFKLVDIRTTIGRGDENSLIIDNLLVSRKHATIIFENGRHAINDLSSINGTYVNGNRIEKHILDNGDVVTLGDVSMIYINELTQDEVKLSYTKKLI